MKGIIFIVGLFLSSLVSVSILFDFMDKLFVHRYKSKFLYIGVEIIYILVLARVNAINIAWLNLLTVLLFTEIIGLKMYSGNKKKILLYNIILIIGVVACESVGTTLLQFIYHSFNITILSPKMRTFINLTITQIIVLFSYQFVILQILKKKNIKELTHKQYFLSFAYALFSFLNIYILSILLSDTSSQRNIMLVLITIVGIVIINTHFMKILEFASENNRLQYENKLFLQQSIMQYQYYDKIEQQYRESLSMIHDANRHIRAIEELYRHKEEEVAVEYTNDISEILNSFKLNEYTENRVLNIILNDKLRLAEQSQINFICKIDNIDLDFIDNIDLTTIFANLLDNAIEACILLKKDKIIVVQVGAFNNLVVINIKNSIDEAPMDIDIDIDMKSSKKNHEGIGIPNVKKVVSKYNGDFNIQREENMFVCSIVLSKQGRVE